MELRLGRDHAISNGLREEIRSLAIRLEAQMKRISNPDSGRSCLAAGTTRLKKIEFIQTPLMSTACSAQADYRFLEEGLLLRARGHKYSSAGMAILRHFGAHSCIEIRIEHERGAALTITTPIRRKRPGFLSTGEPSITSTATRWFLKESPVYLDTN